MARSSPLLRLALGLAAAPAAAQTCFDLAPTIAGAGKSKGTPGHDVILGSGFANVDGGGGTRSMPARGKVRGASADCEITN